MRLCHWKLYFSGDSLTPQYSTIANPQLTIKWHTCNWLNWHSELPLWSRRPWPAPTRPTRRELWLAGNWPSAHTTFYTTSTNFNNNLWYVMVKVFVTPPNQPSIGPESKQWIFEGEIPLGSITHFDYVYRYCFLIISLSSCYHGAWHSTIVP